MSDNETKSIACFFCEYYTVINKPNSGTCRRYAPRPICSSDISVNETYWPEVTVWDWCGEFSRRDRHDSKYFEGLIADD